MDSKVRTVLFVLTFIPYALVLLGGLHGAVFGKDFFFNTYYRLGGFLLGASEMLGSMLVVPIMPVCIVFHLLCLSRNTVPFLRDTDTKEFAGICAVSCLSVFILQLISNNSRKIRQARQKSNAKKMWLRAGEKIPFRESTVFYDGIFNLPECKTNHILIDYDKNEVGFLIYHAGDNEYFETHLSETSPDSPAYRHIADTYYVQSDIPLSSPGKRLITFSDERCRQYTVALMLFYEDGTVFYADNIRGNNKDCGRYFGLDHLKELIRLEDYEKNNREG